MLGQNLRFGMLGSKVVGSIGLSESKIVKRYL